MPRHRYGRFYTSYQISLRSSEKDIYLPALLLQPPSASPWDGKAAVQRLPRGPPQPERYQRQQAASKCSTTARAASHSHSAMRPAGSTEKFESPPARHIKPFSVPRAPYMRPASIQVLSVNNTRASSHNKSKFSIPRKFSASHKSGFKSDWSFGLPE